MTFDEVPVRESDFALYFDENNNEFELLAARVFLLAPEKADRVWRKYISEDANTYFQLPDSSWLVERNLEKIGRWLEAFNSGDRSTIEKLLFSSVDWAQDERVLFCARRNSILRTEWRVFAAIWDCFLCFEDDCPILIRENSDESEALLFTPGGDIQKI